MPIIGDPTPAHTRRSLRDQERTERQLAAEARARRLRVIDRRIGEGKTRELVELMLTPGNEDIVYVAPTLQQALQIGYQMALKILGATPDETGEAQRLRSRFISATELRSRIADNEDRGRNVRYVFDEAEAVLHAIVGSKVEAIALTSQATYETPGERRVRLAAEKELADEVAEWPRAMQDYLVKIGGPDEGYRREYLGTIPGRPLGSDIDFKTSDHPIAVAYRENREAFEAGAALARGTRPFAKPGTPGSVERFVEDVLEVPLEEFQREYLARIVHAESTTVIETTTPEEPAAREKLRDALTRADEGWLNDSVDPAGFTQPLAGTPDLMKALRESLESKRRATDTTPTEPITKPIPLVQPAGKLRDDDGFGRITAIPGGIAA